MSSAPVGVPAGTDVADLVRPGGFLSRWLRFCAPFEFSDKYAIFALLACVSSAIDRRVQVNPDSEPSPYPALYVVLYGPSGCKKGGAIKYATWLFSEALREPSPLPPVRRYPDDFTMEALFGLMSEDSKAGRGARGIVVNEEFADLIGGADYVRRSTALMAKLWDCRHVTSRLTRSHAYEEVIDAYLVALGASSPDWLEMVDPRVLAGGFLRRILLIVEYRGKRLEGRPKRDAVLFRELAAEFRERLGTEEFPPGTLMRLEPSASEAMDVWYKSLSTADWPARDERAQHFRSTIQEHVLRVAACVQLIETGEPTVLTLESWEVARKLVESIIPGMLQAYRSLVPTPLARMKALAARLVAERGEVDPIELDKIIMRSGGLDGWSASRVRAAAIAEGTLKWNERNMIVPGGV